MATQMFNLLLKHAYKKGFADVEIPARHEVFGLG
jgi:hypothetical protein